MDLKQYKTEQLFNILPENLIIYKDSGLWNIEDDNQNELYHQELNEELKNFIIRAILDFRKKIYNESMEYDICMCNADNSYCL